MEKVSLREAKVEEEDALKVAMPAGMVERPTSPPWEEATQRSLERYVNTECDTEGERRAYDEPVSRMTLKETGGVPMANDPKYLRRALRKQSDRQLETDIRQVFAFVSQSLWHDR